MQDALNTVKQYIESLVKENAALKQQLEVLKKEKGVDVSDRLAALEAQIQELKTLVLSKQFVPPTYPQQPYNPYVPYYTSPNTFPKFTVTGEDKK